MTDPLGQSQVIPYLKGLTSFGYEFTILSCDKIERYKTHKKFVNESLAGFPINWVSLPYHKNPPILSSVYDYYNLKKKALALHREKPFNMVHTRPGVPALVGLWLKKNKGIKFLNDIRGFWADERVDGGMWNLDKMVYRKIYHFFKNHEYECLEKADYNVCLTHAAKAEILSWKNIERQPLQIDVIPCSVDLDLFDPAHISPDDKEAKRIAMGISPQDKVITYLGSIGGWYLTNEMLEMCKHIYQHWPEAKFLFISPYQHKEIVQKAMTHGLPEKAIITYSAARHEVPLLLSLSYYSMFFIKACYSKISSSPTKHAEIMAMDIPIITNRGVGDVAEIVEKYQSGIVLDDFTQTEMQAVVSKMKKITYPANEIRLGAMEYYALQNAVLRYRDIYSRIFSS